MTCLFKRKHFLFYYIEKLHLYYFRGPQPLKEIYNKVTSLKIDAITFTHHCYPTMAFHGEFSANVSSDSYTKVSIQVKKLQAWSCHCPTQCHSFFQPQGSSF